MSKKRNWIAAGRARLGWSDQDVSDATGGRVGRPTITRARLGQRELSLQDLLLVAAALNIDPERVPMGEKSRHALLSFAARSAAPPAPDAAA